MNPSFSLLINSLPHSNIDDVTRKSMLMKHMMRLIYERRAKL
jgi:hypothetical protein